MREEPRSSSALATILVSDDLAQWRARVREILCRWPEWQIIGEACDGLEVVRKAAEMRPDPVLLDIGMPVMNGADGYVLKTKAATELFPAISIALRNGHRPN